MRIPMISRMLGGFLLLGVHAAGFARMEDGADAPSHGVAVREWTERQRQVLAGSTNHLVRHGLLADKVSGRVDVLADTTTLSASEPLEFFLVGPESGHDYEAFARSHARAADLHEALRFLEVPPGQPVDFAALRYWPRGERIQVAVSFPDPQSLDDHDAGTWIPAGEIIFSGGRPMATPGFVFTGSYEVPDPRQTNTPALAADAFGPHSLISLYNEPRTLLDVPFLAPQGSVYGTQQLNPEHLSTRTRLVRIRLMPDLLPSGPRSVDVDMVVRGGARRARNPFSGVLVDAKSRLDGASVSGADLTRWLAFLESIQAEDHDIYVHISPDPAMRLEAVSRLYQFLDGLNVPRGARLNGRPERDIYYQAFVPPEDFRHRENRPGQPWELHLYHDSRLSVTGMMKRAEERWPEPPAPPELVPHEHPAATPEAMRRLIDQTPAMLKVLLVYAPETMTYGQLMAWYEALPEDHRTIYIFLRDMPDDIIPDGRP